MSDYMKNSFKTRYYEKPRGGQCFECGLWFTTGSGYACCKEHGKKQGYKESSSISGIPCSQFRSK